MEGVREYERVFLTLFITCKRKDIDSISLNLVLKSIHVANVLHFVPSAGRGGELGT